MKNTKYALAAAVGALLASTSAHAAGFFIQEQSVSAGGSAYAGAVSGIDDASTLFFNPAGMTKLSGAQANLSTQVLFPHSKIENNVSTPGGPDGGNPYHATPVPSGFIATPITMVDGLWMGVGVTAPFGLRNKYDSNWFGRFDSIKTDLTTMDVQPSVAYRINDKISLGAGLDIQKAKAELTNAVDVGAPGNGESQLRGDDWGYGYTVGAQIEVLPQTTLGLNYRSSVHHDLEGNVTILDAPPGGYTAFDASASLVTPDVASIGLTHRLNDKWKIMGQANWFGWNNFDNISVVRDSNGAVASRVNQNYQTVWSYAVGAEYMYSPEWTFRAGLQYDNTPTTDEYRTTRTPDGDRTWIATGATYNINNKLSLDMNLTYIDIADESIDVTRVNVPTSRVVADTSGHVGIVGLGLNYKF